MFGFAKISSFVVVSSLLAACCNCTTTPVPAVQNSGNSKVDVNINVNSGATGSGAGGAAVAQATAQATAQISTTIAMSWDNTCASQSKLTGVELKPLSEGASIACVWHGNGVTTTIGVIPGTITDLDLGGIFVAIGPARVEGVANATVRPWQTGMISEACAQVANLTAYGQTQNPKFTASPWNFDCK